MPVRSRIKPSNVPSAFPEHIILKCDSFILREFEFIFMPLLVVGYGVSQKGNILYHCTVIILKIINLLSNNLEIFSNIKINRYYLLFGGNIKIKYNQHIQLLNIYCVLLIEYILNI